MKPATSLRRFPEHRAGHEQAFSQPQSIARQTPQISLGEPYPFATPGSYRGKCVSATLDWSKRYRKWIAILKFDLLDYTGRPFMGKLCRFFQLGSNPTGPHAGARSKFYKLLAEVNGAVPGTATADVTIFVGCTYEMDVVTVNKGQDGQPIPPELHYSKIDAVRLWRGTSQ